LENVRLRKLDKLHAKLYCTPGGVLIGSSNASADGLGQEGAELSGTVELNTFIAAEAFAAEAEAWFDERWKAAQPIYEAIIESIRHLYERNRAHREQNPTLNADLPPNMPERELAERILMRFLEKAKEIQAEAWRTDVTPVTAAQLMDTDPKWRADYTQFVGDPYGNGERKRKINPLQGKYLWQKLPAVSGGEFDAKQPSIFGSSTHLLPLLPPNGT
jgi:hypothetical protein